MVAISWSEIIKFISLQFIAPIQYFSKKNRPHICFEYSILFLSLPNPSPSPRITLQSMSNGTDCASNGVMTVLMDHSRTASISTVLQPKRLAVLAPMILKERRHIISAAFSLAVTQSIRIIYLTSEISESKRRQYPSLPI